jgi:hypothetical protein
MDSEEFNYESYKDSLNPEDREYFDQLVREEMMKLESGIVQQVDAEEEDDNNEDGRGGGGGGGGGGNFLQSPQRRFVNKATFNDGNSEVRMNKQAQYANQLESDAINAKRVSYDRVANSNMPNPSEGALSGLGMQDSKNARPDLRRAKMDDYRDQLDRQKHANDQAANSVNAPRNNLVNALNQRREDSYNPSGGFNIGSDSNGQRDSNKLKQLEYAKQLQDQMQNQQLNGQGSGRRGQNPQDYQGRNSDSYGSLPANYIKVVSGREVQKDPHKEAETEEKRRKQQEYYDALRRDSHAKSDPNSQPAPRASINRRGQQDDRDNEYSSNTGFNIGADSNYAKELAREKQLIYAQQLQQAKNAEPIPQTKVRLQSKSKNAFNDDDYSDGHTFNIGSGNGQNFRPQRSGRSADEIDDANRKLAKASEYSRQLNEDLQRKQGKVEDNRGQFQYENVEHHSPGKKFASGLDARDGSEDYARRMRQMEYAKALDNDVRSKESQKQQKKAAEYVNDGHSFTIGSESSQQGGRGSRNKLSQAPNNTLALAGNIALNSREREYENQSNPPQNNNNNNNNRNQNNGGGGGGGGNGNNSGRSNAPPAPMAYTKNPASRGNSHGGGVSSVFFG